MRVLPSLAATLLLAAAAVAQRTTERPLANVRVRETFVEDVQYADGFAKEPRRNRLDLYVPDLAGAGAAASGRPPLVMFVHGGAWTGGNKEFGAQLAHALVQRGVACACINTQLFPFARPEAMVADCGRALAWLHTHAGEHGYDGGRLFVMGHSAGGHLVSWLALDGVRRAATGVPDTALRGVIALSGVHELRARHPALEKVFGTDTAKRREASPFAHASAGDPPMLLLWGEHDMPGLALCARMLRDRLRQVGVSVIAEQLAGCDHVDYVARLGMPGDRVLDRIVAFVQAPPPATVAAPTPSSELTRTMVHLGAGQPRLELVRPDQGARLTMLWVAADERERADAEQLLTALSPHGVAVVVLAGEGLAAATIEAVWRALRAQAGGLVVPAPSVLGGGGASAAVVADTRLGGRDGLRARLLVAADPGRGAAAAALVARLGGAGRSASAVLFVQGAGDAKAQRDSVVTVGMQLAQRQVDVHVIEVPDRTSGEALQQLGAPDDVLLPLLRAFVLP